MLSDLIPHRCCVYNLYYILVSVFHCFVGNVRKAMTIVLSFCLFPKPFSYLYIVGGMLVFGSLIGTEITKEHMKKDKKNEVDNLDESQPRGTVFSSLNTKQLRSSSSV